MRFGLILACVIGFGLPAAAQEYEIGGYSAWIGSEDLFNSRGVRLTDPVAIIRQDRANVHRFGIRHGAEDIDPWFGQQGTRAAMPGLIANGGGIHPAYRQPIVNGNVPVYVRVFVNGGVFTRMVVEVPG